MPETIEKIKEIAKSIFGFGNKPQAVESEIDGWQRPVSKELEELDRQSIRNDRRTKIVDCQEMAKIDPRVRRMLKKLSDDSIVGGLSLNVETAPTDAEKEKAQHILTQMLKDCKIQRKLKGWGKILLREGDLFLQIYIDEVERKIYWLKKLATEITFSTLNSEGRFPEGESAYYQEHPMTREKTKEFEQWQIVHLPWEEEDGQAYGEPMFSSSRLHWKRLDNGEKNISIRRAVRAGRRQHHKIGSAETPDWQLVNQYKQQNRDTLDNPAAVSQDYFTTGNIDITEIGGDAELGDLNDIQHFEGLVFMAAGIPVALLSGGREENVNRDILEEQEEDYYRVVDDINNTFENGFRPIFDLALLLKGFNPDVIEYTFNWGNKDRDDLDAKIARGKEMQALGYSFETIHNEIGLSKITYEEELERINTQKEVDIVPYGISMSLDSAILQALINESAEGINQEQLEALVTKLDELKQVAEQELSPQGKIITMGGK